MGTKGGDSIDVVAIVVSVVLILGSFRLGMYVADCYNERSARKVKDALERQYLRLRAGSDADDPCGPYQYYQPSGFTPDLLDRFERRLKKNKFATVQLNKKNKI